VASSLYAGDARTVVMRWFSAALKIFLALIAWSFR
jgi:hypothetical protein